MLALPAGRPRGPHRLRRSGLPGSPGRQLAAALGGGSGSSQGRCCLELGQLRIHFCTGRVGGQGEADSAGVSQDSKPRCPSPCSAPPARLLPRLGAAPARPLPPPDPHAPARRHPPSMAAWKKVCACGRLSLKVGVIMPFSTEKGSWCRCTAATWGMDGGKGVGWVGWGR